MVAHSDSVFRTFLRLYRGKFILLSQGCRKTDVFRHCSVVLQKCIQIVIMNAFKAIYRGDAMKMLTVRNLPEDVHRALRVQAALHGHSTEAEVREILAVAVKPEARVRLGDALAALGQKIGLTNEDFDVFNQVRDKTPAQPLSFE